MERKRLEEFSKCNSTDEDRINSQYNYVLGITVVDYREYIVEIAGASGQRVTKTVNYSKEPDCF
mgnify:FL=1